jgi:uncharacterized protein YceK
MSKVFLFLVLLILLSGCATVYVTHGENGGSANTTVVAGDVNQVARAEDTLAEELDAALLEVFLNVIAVLGLGVVLWYFFYPHGGEKWPV